MPRLLKRIFEMRWLVLPLFNVVLMIVDPESDLAVATLAQLLLQEGRPTEALEYFDKSVELGRTEQELVSALSYAEVPTLENI
jgi:hypothetical protein